MRLSGMAATSMPATGQAHSQAALQASRGVQEADEPQPVETSRRRDTLPNVAKVPAPRAKTMGADP